MRDQCEQCTPLHPIQTLFSMYGVEECEAEPATVVGQKRQRGERSPQSKLKQKATTARRKVDCVEGHVRAHKPMYKLGKVSEQVLQVVLVQPMPERDLDTAWSTFCGWLIRRLRLEFPLVDLAAAGRKSKDQRHLYRVMHALMGPPM